MSTETEVEAPKKAEKPGLFGGAAKVHQTDRVEKAAASPVMKEETIMHSARVPREMKKAIKMLAVTDETTEEAITREALRMFLRVKGFQIA